MQHETAEGYYLGIDPGRDKTGLALVDKAGTVFAVQIVRTRAFSDSVLKFLYDQLQVSNAWGLRKKLKAIVIGDGTGSEEHPSLLHRKNWRRRLCTLWKVTSPNPLRCCRYLMKNGT